MRPVTLYGPNGDAVAQPSLVDLARLPPPETLAEVVEVLSRNNPLLQDGPYAGPWLLDQFGRRVEPSMVDHLIEVFGQVRSQQKD